MDKIQEIREALQAATPGPWKWLGDSVCLFPQGGVDYGDYILFIQKTAGVEAADAHLIANAPEWLSYLLSELDAAKQENERLTSIEVATQLHNRLVKKYGFGRDEAKG